MKMNEQLLIRFLTHTCTPQEMQEVDAWIAADKANSKWLFETEEIWGLKNELKASDRKEIEKAYKLFKSNVISKRNPKSVQRFTLKRSLNLLKYAAVAAILVLLGINLYKMNNKPDMYSQLEIPKGQYLTLILSDSTKVWLNAESKLKYPAQFTADERVVELEGEAYFEVTYNKKSPFIVKSSLLNVKVLGTKFDMRAYNNEPAMVSLVEGSVEVESYDHANKTVMKPNQQLSYTKRDGMDIRNKKDISSSNSWIKGELEFQDIPLSDICLELQRKFNVSIYINDLGLQKELFTCHFKDGITINEVLLILKETRKMDYSIIDKQIKIFKYGKPMRN